MKRCPLATTLLIAICGLALVGAVLQFVAGDPGTVLRMLLQTLDGLAAYLAIITLPIAAAELLRTRGHRPPAARDPGR